MYYVYRYLNKSEIVYIGITNDISARHKQHKRDSWYQENLKYEFVKVDNKYIARLYEEYLINLDTPKYNIAGNNNYDVSCISFDIDNNWIEFNKDIEKARVKPPKKQNTSIKRVSLYFNLDNPIENKMWEYLESGRSKSNTIKNLLEDKINGIESPMIKNKIVEKGSEKKEPKENLELALDKDELDMAGMNGF